MSSRPSADGVPPTGGVTPEGLIPMRRLAYTVLPPSMSRRRRARVADAIAHRALLQGASRQTARAHLIREVLHGSPGSWVPAPVARLIEPSTPNDRAVDAALSAMVPASRAALALLHLEGLTAAQTAAVLEIAGVQDALNAVSLAERCPLDPAALRSLVVRVPTTAVTPRLAAAVAACLVLAVAAPVVAVNAFSGDGSAPTVVASQSALDSEREAAMSAATVALRETRERALTVEAAETAEKRLQRTLHRLNDAIHQKGVSRKELRHLRELRADVRRELNDVRAVAAGN